MRCSQTGSLGQSGRTVGVLLLALVLAKDLQSNASLQCHSANAVKYLCLWKTRWWEWEDMLGIQTLCDIWAASFLDCFSEQLAATVHTVPQPWHARKPKRDVLELKVQDGGASLLKQLLYLAFLTSVLP